MAEARHTDTRRQLHPRVALLRQARLDQGLTMEQLADRAGVSRWALGKWLTGQTMPNVEAYVLVAGALGFEVDVRPVGGPR